MGRIFIFRSVKDEKCGDFGRKTLLGMITMQTENGHCRIILKWISEKYYLRVEVTGDGVQVLDFCESYNNPAGYIDGRKFHCVRDCQLTWHM
jgi:hypothetical protein